MTNQPHAAIETRTPALASSSVQLALLIAGTALLRLIFAATTGLGVDESYMVAAGRILSLGYFDHPPTAWWLSWGAAHLFGTEAPIVVRLPFIALFALSTWLTARIGTMLAGPRAGLWAAVLLNLSPVFGITTATWVLPDGPLDCALLAAALCLLHALSAEGAGRAGAQGTVAPEAARRAAQGPRLQGYAGLGWWCGAGLCAGLAMFSKYTAVLSMAGAFGYLLATPRHRAWLARPQPYIAALLALLVFSPVLIWNATHHWASFAFQGDRAEGLRFHPLAPLAVLGGEALFVLPWIWAPMMAVWVATLRRGPKNLQHWLLSWLAAPPIVLFAAIAIWSSQRILFHWAAPGYLMLFPLLGEALVPQLHRPALRRTLLGTAALAIGAVAVISVQLSLGWLHPVIAAVARKDPTIEGIDWTSIRTDLQARGLLPPGTVVGVPSWRDAGKVAYALGPDITVLCLNKDSRQFGLAYPAPAFRGRDILIIAPEQPASIPARLGGDFTSLRRLPDAAITHAGHTLQPVGVFRGDHFRGLP